MNRRSVTRLAALGVLAALLTGCAVFPSSGVVHQGTTEVPEPGQVYLGTPDSPQQGATPVEIVQGFIDAQAQGVSDDFTVAKEYLSPQADDWNPWDSVTVFSGEPDLGASAVARSSGGTQARPDVQPSPTLSPGQKTVVHASLTSLASVDTDGEFSQEPVGTQKQLTFTLVVDPAGQWRIAQLDDGIEMSSANFGSVFRAVSAYFPTTDHDVLLPDVRWFPQRTAPTQAVKAVLAGPVSWLRDSVDSVVPEGTELSVDSVVVDPDGLATVDLTASALTASAVDRAILQQQLDATLEQFSGIQSVKILAAGAPMSIPVTTAMAKDPSPGDSVYVLTGGQVRRLDAQGQPTGVGGVLAPGGNPTALALSVDVKTVVVRQGTDQIELVSGDKRRTLLTAPGLVAPSVDRLGWVWTASAAHDGALLAVDASGHRTDVTAAWLEGRTVRSLQVSRDGARIVLVTAGPGGVTQVVVAGVVRNDAGAPSRLSDPVAIGATLENALQAVWVDEDTVAVLGRATAGASPTVGLVPLGGFAQSLSSVPDVVSLTSGRGEHTIYVATSADVLWGRTATGASWTQVASKVTWPAFPG